MEKKPAQREKAHPSQLNLFPSILQSAFINNRDALLVEAAKYKFARDTEALRYLLNASSMAPIFNLLDLESRIEGRDPYHAWTNYTVASLSVGASWIRYNGPVVEDDSTWETLVKYTMNTMCDRVVAIKGVASPQGYVKIIKTDGKRFKLKTIIKAYLMRSMPHLVHYHFRALVPYIVGAVMKELPVGPEEPDGRRTRDDLLTIKAGVAVIRAAYQPYRLRAVGRKQKVPGSIAHIVYRKPSETYKNGNFAVDYRLVSKLVFICETIMSETIFPGQMMIPESETAHMMAHATSSLAGPFFFIDTILGQLEDLCDFHADYPASINRVRPPRLDAPMSEMQIARIFERMKKDLSRAEGAVSASTAVRRGVFSDKGKKKAAATEAPVDSEPDSDDSMFAAPTDAIGGADGDDAVGAHDAMETDDAYQWPYAEIGLADAA
ncbi:hypothetical protein NM688_g1325 [Phlebia brevispora]|uniref:Uncharacterized protein n=1 Tax=Phlebia brevispora TaxID=194682 RepID=A0ACC1TBM6_9APHY|nr:hypothetical protein NM688_g1325 [Phlebia brevispora]